jgi:AraC-like DNA-binding protein
MSDSARVVLRRSIGGSWESITRPPSPALRPYVHDYEGYDIAATSAASRHVPPPYVPMILGFGGAMRMRTMSGNDDAGAHRTFVAGLHDTWVDSTTDGRSTGVQVNLTPIGGYMLLGMPMSEITHRVIDVEDLLGTQAHDLGERLNAAGDWHARMDIIDALLEERLKAARPASPAVAWAWKQLAVSGGNASIGSLAEHVGWSRKHMINRFREQIGLPPKTAGRILRFNRVLRFVARGSEMTWASIAMACGYYDQAHLIRDFKDFSGETPTVLLAGDALARHFLSHFSNTARPPSR